MIIVETMGGLGNQMFQYAFGLAQAKRFGTELVLDIRENNIDTFRPFNLDLFQIKARVGIEASPNHRTVRQGSMLYDPNINDRVADGDRLVGYWQSEKYFAPVADVIREQFRPRKHWTNYGLEYVDWIVTEGKAATMVGIRRTDYVTVPSANAFQGVLPHQYYVDALDVVRRTIGREPVAFVFSDDTKWVRENWDLGVRTLYVSGDMTVPGYIGREDIDLSLMSFCNSAIIANSSFHWWGAWLGERSIRRTGPVVAPKRWFRDQQAQDQTADIVPERWLRI
jgi:Glycosyl transferase family 11